MDLVETNFMEDGSFFKSPFNLQKRWLQGFQIISEPVNVVNLDFSFEAFYRCCIIS